MILSNEKNNITKLLDRNQMTIKNVNGIEQNMGKLLDFNSTINYENCQNLVIDIESKINRICFRRCKNMEVRLNGLISGIEIKDSSEIYIDNGIKKSVNSVIVERSSEIRIVMSKKIHKETVYQIDSTKDIIVEDHNGKKLILKEHY